MNFLVILRPKYCIIQREREPHGTLGFDRGGIGQPSHQGKKFSKENCFQLYFAKVEAAAKKQAKQDFEAERRAMQEKMETEISELQTHLK